MCLPFCLWGFDFHQLWFFSLILNRVKFSDFHKSVLIKGLVLGVLMFLGYGLQTAGLNYTTASRSGFITYFYALLVPLFQFLILRKRPLLVNLGGLAVAFTGLSLITGGLGSGSMNPGDLLTLLSAASYSIYIVLLNLWSADENPSVLTALQLLVTALFSFLFVPFFEEPVLISHPALWLNLLYLSLLGSVVAVYVMTRFQNSITPTRAALLYSLEPVFSVILAVLILREHFSGLQIIGSLLIISGVLLSEIFEIRKTETGQTL